MSVAGDTKPRLIVADTAHVQRIAAAYRNVDCNRAWDEEVIEWHFCRRFNPWTRDAAPDEHSWIDEQEARRRYRTSGESLTLVPPVDVKTGIAPYYIVVTPREHPSFTVVQQVSPAFGVGAKASEIWWKSLGDGRLFSHIASVYEYGIYNPQLPPQVFQPVAKVQSHNNEDGTGWTNFVEFNPPSRMRADRDQVLVDEMYAAEPAWSEWDALV